MDCLRDALKFVKKITYRESFKKYVLTFFKPPWPPPSSVTNATPIKQWPPSQRWYFFLRLPFIDFLAAFVTCIYQFGANCHMDNKSIFKCQAARIWVMSKFFSLKNPLLLVLSPSDHPLKLAKIEQSRKYLILETHTFE